MSENLDLVRSIYADWERGEYRFAQWADPEIEFVIADGPAPGRWKGLAGLGTAARDQMNAWEGLRFEADEYRQLDDERVLVVMHFTEHGKQSGLEMGRCRRMARPCSMSAAARWRGTHSTGKPSAPWATSAWRSSGVSGEVMTTVRSTPATNDMGSVAANV